MYMLVPDEPNLGFVTVAVIFVAATLLGFASHAPGGLGVFDAAMMVALWQFDKEDLLAGLLLFRLLYYIVPFVISLVVLGSRELLLGRLSRRIAQATAPPMDTLSERVVEKIGRVLMSVSDNRARCHRAAEERVARRCRTGRSSSAAVIFAGLAVAGALAVVYAVAGFAIVAAAAVFALRDNGDDPSV